MRREVHGGHKTGPMYYRFGGMYLRKVYLVAAAVSCVSLVFTVYLQLILHILGRKRFIQT